MIDVADRYGVQPGAIQQAADDAKHGDVLFLRNLGETTSDRWFLDEPVIINRSDLKKRLGLRGHNQTQIHYKHPTARSDVFAIEILDSYPSTARNGFFLDDLLVIGSNCGSVAVRHCFAPLITNCRLSGIGGIGVGLWCEHSFLGRAVASRFTWHDIGIYTTGHFSCSDCDVVGNTKGLVANGSTLSATACRLEVNGTAIVLGQDYQGNRHLLGRSVLSGISMEANDIGLHCDHVAKDVIVQGIGVQGSSNAPSGMSETGILLEPTASCMIQGFSANVNFTNAAMECRRSKALLQSGFLANNLGPSLIGDTSQLILLSVNY